MKNLNSQYLKLKNNINVISWVAVLFCLSFPVHATSTHRYFYDETGQLTKSVDATGIVIEYVYDEVGNRLETNRTVTSGLVIFHFSPPQGAVGDIITIEGQQFSTIPTNNTVTINGVAANVIGASATQLQIEIPATASNGFIEVGVTVNTAQSDKALIVIKPPVINAIIPNVIVSNPTGISSTDIAATGFNFNAATFTLLPEFFVPPASIGGSIINPDGLSATISLSLQADISGSFTLVGTNTEGSSSTFPSNKNTITILQGSADEDNDGLSNYDESIAGTDFYNPDSDGDGFMDGDEVADGSDPMNIQQTPLHVLSAFVGKGFSVRNNAVVFKDAVNNSTFTSKAISIQNQAVTFTDINGNNTFTGEPISVQNQALTFPNNIAVSETISIENQAVAP